MFGSREISQIKSSPAGVHVYLHIYTLAMIYIHVLQDLAFGLDIHVHVLLEGDDGCIATCMIVAQKMKGTANDV